MRTNGKINVYRLGAPTPTGVQSLVRWFSLVPARITLRRRSVTSDEGSVLATDGEIVVGTHDEIREGDFVDIEKRREVRAAPTQTRPRYRVEQVNEQYNAGGRIVGLRLLIIKDRPKARV